MPRKKLPSPLPSLDKRTLEFVVLWLRHKAKALRIVADDKLARSDPTYDWEGSGAGHLANAADNLEAIKDAL
jgi:hypothetical protein